MNKEPQAYVNDPEDSAADKCGSYYLGHQRLDMPESTDDVSVAAIVTRQEAARGVLMSPQGKSTGKYVSGPQMGEETAPVADQRRTPEEQETIRRNMGEKIVPILAEIQAGILQKRADKLGIPPAALQRKHSSSK